MCDHTALRQRGRTCYMSSATLLFGRVALPHVASSAHTQSVRNYIAHSMRDLWDQAQGKEEDETCPRIPKRVRQYYSVLRDARLTYHDDPYVVTRGEYSAAAKTAEVDELVLARGGYPHLFTAALFWAASLPCDLAMYGVELDRDQRAVADVRRSDLAAHLAETAADTFARRRRRGHFYVLHVFFMARVHQRGVALAYVSPLLRALRARLAEREYDLRAALLSATNDDGSRKHTVSAYPCAEEEWTLCDTRDGVCFSTLAEGARALARTYSSVSYGTFVLRGT